jgi:uncharacterized protein (DUF305 family)
MFPYHQEAIDSSNALLAISTDEDVRSAVEAIVAAQDNEVTI